MCINAGFSQMFNIMGFGMALEACMGLPSDRLRKFFTLPDKFLKVGFSNLLKQDKFRLKFSTLDFKINR